MAWDWDKLQQQKRRQSGGGPQGPQGIEDLINRLKGSKGKFPGGFLLIVIGVVLALLAISCFYTVGVDEVGIVQRFGKYVRTTQPGLNFKLPAGIEKVTKVRVRHVFKEEFGFRTVRSGVRTHYAAGRSYENEFLMLTGDLNVAVVPWVVQYRIRDPYNYLFKIRNVRSTLRDLSESTMRLVVGDRSINEVISKREEIAHTAQELLQKEMDEAESGIVISTIELKKTNVPEPVQPSFNAVNQAIQKKEELIYQARQEYNKVIPAARGQAEKTIRSAEGFAVNRVNRAQGDAARFLKMYEEYVKAKDITKKRLYLEAIQDIFPKLGDKYIVDSDQKNFLPLLNIQRAEGDKQ